MKRMHSCCDEDVYRHRNKSISSVLIGLAVLSAGVILLLKKTGYIDPFLAQVLLSWPMILILIGIVNLAERSYLTGLIFLAVGSFFIGTRFYGLPISFGDVFWPGILILVGLLILFKSTVFKRKRFDNKVITLNNIYNFEDTAIFGGGEKSLKCDELKQGKITAIFGGSKLNLQQCTLSPEGCTIELVCVFGGAEIIVPADWNITYDVANVLGGISDKRDPAGIDLTKKVHIKGVCVLGGGEIKA